MEKEKIDRINALARKKKAEGLTPEETAEHEGLRREYIDGFRENMQQILDHVVIQRPDGTKQPLQRKDQGKPYKH